MAPIWIFIVLPLLLASPSIILYFMERWEHARRPKRQKVEGEGEGDWDNTGRVRGGDPERREDARARLLPVCRRQ